MTARPAGDARRELGSLASDEIALVRALRSAKAKDSARLDRRMASVEETLSDIKGMLMRFTGTMSEKANVTPFQSPGSGEKKTPATIAAASGPGVRVQNTSALGPEPSLPPDTTLQDLVKSGRASTDRRKNSWMVWAVVEGDADEQRLQSLRETLKARVASSYKPHRGKRPKGAGSPWYFICKHAGCPVELRIDPLTRRDGAAWRPKVERGWCLRRLVGTPGVLIDHNHDPGDMTPGVSRRRIVPADAFGDAAVGVDAAEQRLVWGVPDMLRPVIHSLATTSDTRAGKGAAAITAALVDMQRDGDIPADVPLPTREQIKVCRRVVS